MKIFNVHLQGEKIVAVQAEAYRREGDQYVFDKSNSDEVQFFAASEVTGIVEAIPPMMPSPVIRKPRALDG